LMRAEQAEMKVKELEEQLKSVREPDKIKPILVPNGKKE